MCNLSQGIVDDTKAEIILNMFKKGYTLEQIADVTEKSISEIEKIVKKEACNGVSIINEIMRNKRRQNINNCWQFASLKFLLKKMCIAGFV